MNALESSCSGLSSAVGTITLTPTQGVVALLGLFVLAMLLCEGIHRWVQEGDEQIAAARRFAEDQSLAIATEVTAPYSGAVPPQIPTQRVDNGEDLLADLHQPDLGGEA